MTSLVFAPSSLLFEPGGTDYIFAGVGPFLRVYHDRDLIAEFKFFPDQYRFKNMIWKGNNLIIFAENLLKTVEFTDGYTSFKIIEEQLLDDWILHAGFDNNQVLTLVLNHGQIIKYNPKKEIMQPKDWKIITSAFIDDKRIFLGDSFGTISVSSNTCFECMLDYGSVFCLDYNSTNQTLLAAHEFKSASLLKVYEDHMDVIWTKQEHPSRVWGCKFLHAGPISYGEDGSIHIYDDSNRIFHLHRTKNMTAFTSKDNIIATAGQNAIIRKFKLPDPTSQPESFTMCPPVTKKNKQPHAPVSVSLFKDKMLVGTFNGDVLILPEKTHLIESNGKYSAWYQISSNHKYIFGASRNHFHFISDGTNTKVFEHSNKLHTISCDINNHYAAVIYNDNHIHIYNHDGEEISSLPLEEYSRIPPIAMSIDPHSFRIAIGSHSSRLIILEYSDGFFEMKKVTMLTSQTTDGFQSLLFHNDLIYAAGRTDGLVTILGEIEDEWVIKSSWRIASQCKSTIHLESIENDTIVVSVLMKDSIGIWNLSTQTMIAQFPFNYKRTHLALHVRTLSFSAVWCDSTVVYYQKGDCISSDVIGTYFHGFRGLCSSKFGDIIATGSCDRDIRLWKVVNSKLCCIENVQGVDSGTHSICFHESGLMFSGGSKEFLFVWKLYNDRLYQQNVFTIGERNSKCQLRVTSLACSPTQRLYIGMSDASMLVYDYQNNQLTFVEKIEITGVPMSMCWIDEVLAVATSSGDCFWYKGGNLEIHKITNTCGIHCIQMIRDESGNVYSLTSGDDGSIRVYKTHDDHKLLFKHCGGHKGGIKSVTAHISNDKIRIISFSYDQNVHLINLSLQNCTIESETDFPTVVSDGESIQHLSDGFVLFGAGIQYINL